jgi:hypothetical protein
VTEVVIVDVIVDVTDEVTVDDPVLDAEEVAELVCVVNSQLRNRSSSMRSKIRFSV